MSDRRPFTITKLQLHEDGVWRARVTVDGSGVDVDRKYGSWRIVPKPGATEQQVITEVAIELCKQVRAIENARGPRKKTGDPVVVPNQADVPFNVEAIKNELSPENPVVIG